MLKNLALAAAILASLIAGQAKADVLTWSLSNVQIGGYNVTGGFVYDTMATR